MKLFSKIISNILKIIIGFVFIIPLLWVFISSFKSNQDIISNPLGLPKNISLANYDYAWNAALFERYFLNSIIVVAGALILLVAISTLAAYAFAKFKMPLGKLLMYLVLFGLIIPPIIILFPIYRFFDSIGLINNLFGLILLYSAFGIPFSIFLLRAYFLSFPNELMDAAQIDGCNRLKTFLRVVLPVSRGAIATVVIFNFISFWNEFLFVYVLINKEGLKTLPAGLALFLDMFSTNYGSLFAAVMIATIPVVIVFLFFQRYFIDALAGSLKG